MPGRCSRSLPSDLPSQAVFAPSISTGRLVSTYDTGIAAINTNMLKAFNETLWSFKAAVDAGQVPTLTQQNWADYNKTIGDIANKIKDFPTAQSEWQATAVESAWPGLECLCGLWSSVIASAETVAS